MERTLRIVFMGTPHFAVEPLKEIIAHGYEVVAVVTSPDKPAGRGRHLSVSPVKEFALQQGLRVLQPVNLKAATFIEELHSLNANLQVVVAFRMLPEGVWRMPEFGTFNLHASLLPQYRGAAPINWAIMNGETETGITTFFLSHEIDTGNIIFREKHPILPDDCAGTLHDRLMTAGAGLVLQTLEAISHDRVQQIPQETVMTEGLIYKTAPKLFKEDCLINWSNSSAAIHNLIRGLSPYPAASATFKSPDGELVYVKIFKSAIMEEESKEKPGKIKTDGKNFIHLTTGDGVLGLTELQVAGKKRLKTAELLRGFELSEAWTTA
jgi:methionyl-tRNA formyltransferase